MGRRRVGGSDGLGKEKKLPSGQNKWLAPFFLLIWLLTKIGSVPSLVFNIPLKFSRNTQKTQRARKSANQKVRCLIPLTSPTHLTFRVLPSFLRKKHRGRPRELPLRIYLYRKIRKFTRKFIPSPLRMGIVLGVILVGIFIYSLFLIVIARDLPSPDKLNDETAPLTTQFFDRNGTLLYRLYEGRNRTLVHLNDLPQNLINATISIEDKNFWGHPGVDFVGVGRALLSDTHGTNLQGGSTITQQLIKNSLLSSDRTWQRKAKELLLSFWSERLFTKQQILEMYFNRVAYGGPAWGIEAASQTYFQKSSHDLDLAEASFLAGLPASPTTYSPYGPHPERGKERQKQVLARMVEDGYITREQGVDALSENLNFHPPISSIQAPHFVMYVRSLLAQKYGDRLVSQGGLQVTTSLDLNTQKMTEEVVSDEVAKLAPLNVTNGAAMVEDPRNGQILAMVGSKDYFNPDGGNFNVALSPRQPGSSIKPITYATSFKQGYSPGTVLLDAPVVFTNPWGQSYSPINYDGTFHGAVTIRTALGSSYNVPAVKTLSLVGIPNMLKTAHDMGITTLNDADKYGLSLTLGAGEIRLVDMMSVYSTLATLGIKHEPTPILKVVDSKGEVLEDNTQDNGIRVLSPGIAYMIDNILSDNTARTPAFGPNSLLYIPDHTVAVKTGTTDSKRDNWTFGFTPNLTVGVWVGNNDNSPMDPALTSGITGASPIWNKIITNLLADQDDVAFERPPEVVLGEVDGHQDLVISGQAQKNISKIGRGKKKDAITGEEKDVITYSDPFSSFAADNSGQILKP